MVCRVGKRRLVTLSQGGGVFPLRGEDGSRPTLDFDAASDKYWWNGALHPRSDLTTVAGTPTWGAEGVLIDGTDRLQIPTTSVPSWFSWLEGTFYVEWFREDNAAVGYVASLRGGSGGTAVRVDVSIGTDRRATFALIDGAAPGGGVYAVNTSQPSTFPRTNRGRGVMAYSVGQPVSIADRGVLTNLVTNQASLVGVSPTEAAVGYFRGTNLSQLMGYAKRIIFWPKRYSDSWITGLSARSSRSLHLLGDSFATAEYLQAGAAASMLNDDRTFSIDGVGGSSLTEQAARYALAPQHWGKTVVIMNGGLEGTLAENIAAINAIAANAGRMLFVEPSPAELAAGTADRIAWDAHRDGLLAHVGVDRWVPTLARALTLGDGGANDNADIANSIWPRSLRVDTMHPTVTGWAGVIGYQVANKLATNGW